MTEIILRCLILSITTIGICCTFWDDMIFDKIGDRFKNWLGKKLKPNGTYSQRIAAGEFYAKPLFGCYVCATFWYSLILCAVLGWQWWLCVPAMGISAIISQLSHD